jgi:hypothetical protein
MEALDKFQELAEIISAFIFGGSKFPRNCCYQVTTTLRMRVACCSGTMEEATFILNKETTDSFETVVDVTFAVTNAAGSFKTFVEVYSVLTLKV